MHLLALTITHWLVFAAALPAWLQHNPQATDLVRIDPSTASCVGASAAECRTAADASQYIAMGFDQFGVTDFNTQAALVALMLYESGGFKYSINHYPGVPGQGTRNMQSPAYNVKYASYLSTVQSSGVTASKVRIAQANGPDAVLALVNSDPWGFASAAWFLTTQCSPTVREGLATGTQEGWNTYLIQCVGTSATADRLAIWNTAVALQQWSG